MTDDDAELSASLAMLVQQAFPTLGFNNRRLEQSGGDHVLLIADDVVFRFPRDGMHDLGLEIAVLQRLQSSSPVAIPDYRYVDPAGRFAGYVMIPGAELTPARFTTLTGTQRGAVLETAAKFLATLHELPSEMIAPLRSWPITETPAEYAEHGLADNVPIIARTIPQYVTAIEEFYRRYRDMPPVPKVVVHGDLASEHLLLDERTGRLCGIIDFSDVALGDAAQDFFGFWAYGADTVRQLVDLYGRSATDPGLLARSRDHFIRYRLGRICEAMREDELDADAAAAAIAALPL